MTDLEERLGLIHVFIDERTEDRLACFDLFSTEEGILLGEQLSKLDSFVIKGSLFSIPFGEFIERIKAMIASGELRAMIPKEQIDAEGEKMLDCLEMFLAIENNDSDEESTVEQLFGKDEIPRLLATLTFSAFTYLESYSRIIVAKLADHGDLASQMVIRIQLYQKELPEKNRPKLVEAISDLLNMGLKRRLKHIVIGLGLETTLADTLGDKYEFFQSLFVYFVEMRHNLAHTDPAPPYEDYQHDYFDNKLKEFREQFSSISQDILEPRFAKLLEPIERWVEEMSGPLARIMAVGEMATIYPSMIDAALSIYLTDS